MKRRGVPYGTSLRNIGNRILIALNSCKMGKVKLKMNV
jgi:hypothetical protein